MNQDTSRAEPFMTILETLVFITAVSITGVLGAAVLILFSLLLLTSTNERDRVDARFVCNATLGAIGLMGVLMSLSTHLLQVSFPLLLALITTDYFNLFEVDSLFWGLAALGVLFLQLIGPVLAVGTILFVSKIVSFSIAFNDGPKGLFVRFYDNFNGLKAASCSCSAVKGNRRHATLSYARRSRHIDRIVASTINDYLSEYYKALLGRYLRIGKYGEFLREQDLGVRNPGHRLNKKDIEDLAREEIGIPLTVAQCASCLPIVVFTILAQSTLPLYAIIYRFWCGRGRIA